MRRIVVGVDGSQESRDAAKWAVDIAKATGAKVLVATSAYALSPMTSPEVFINTQSWQNEERKLSAKTVEGIAAAVSRNGVAIETFVGSGTAAEMLADLARAADVDLVVVGHRGRGAVARMLLGSVADRLVQISPKPVLVVR